MHALVNICKKSLQGAMLSFAALSSLLVGSQQARATDLDDLQSLGQRQFQTLVENVGAATHYKAISSAEPLGVIGFDVAVELSVTEIDDEIFDIASGGSFELSRFLLPRIHVHKGLPFGVDLGAFYTAIPDTDFKALGAELKYAFLEGSTLTPAVAFRAHYSVIQGVDELDLTNAGLELSISKGFLMLTPYAGIGVVRTTGTPNDVPELREESVDLEKVYVGMNINLGFNVGIEADRTGDYTTFSLKTGLRF